jgi:hypothetical protein
MLTLLKITTAISLLLLFQGARVRGLEYEAICDPSRLPYSSNPVEYDYNRCDPRQGLFCNTYSRCDCYVVDSYYDDYLGKCVGKIGHPCQATPSFSISCGENAECEGGTGFCRCEEGYFQNYDRRGCNGSERAGGIAGIAAMVILVLVARMLF